MSPRTESAVGEGGSVVTKKLFLGMALGALASLLASELAGRLPGSGTVSRGESAYTMRLPLPSAAARDLLLTATNGGQVRP
jgi:hypothetical protein